MRGSMMRWLCVSIAAAQQHLDPKLFDAAARLATSRVDHACPNTPRRGRDPCACQLACTDLQCANARRRCDNEFAWCSDMDTNAAKRIEKKVATLKVKGPAWSVSEDAFGPFSVVRGRQYVSLIGEQKCGTTLLYDALVNSPHFVRAPNGRKEQHFFDSHHVIDACRSRSYVNGLGRRGGIVDASPDYLADPIAAVHLSRFIPQAHIILLWRDPVKRAHAAWDQNRRAGSEDRPFNDAVAQELPVFRRCVDLAPAVAQFIEGKGNSSSGHSLVEYVERCAHFIDGQPKNCWVNKNYNIRPACKRYLYKGLYGDHAAMYAALFPRVGAVRAEALFAETARVLGNVARFLGVDNVVPPRKQTCWHDCGTRKSAFSISESLRIQLEALYAPSQRRFEALINAGRVADLS